MAQEIINQLITTALGLGILGSAYLVDLLIGTVKVLFTKDMKWNFKKAFEDFTKALIMAVGIEGWVVLWSVTDWYAKKCGVDISAVTDGLSVAGMVGAILGGTMWYLVNAFNNAKEFISTKHIEVNVSSVNYSEIADKVFEYFDTPKEAVEAHKEFEEEAEKEEEKIDGGRGNHYSVPHDSYDKFRNAVLGKGFDLDGAYLYQCWDGSCLLWQQIGRWLQTGDGSARGCWKLKKNENAGNDFELITNIKDVKRGDVMFFDCGSYGHTGYADENYNGSGRIKLLGQNQSSDMKFCVVSMSTSTFLGAMRFKQWKIVDPAPVPVPQPSKKGYVSYTYKKGDTFGQVICNLGLKTSHGLWGSDGDVAYYTKQLNEQGIYGNIPVGTTIKLTPRK